jgi:hypothetical protein
MSKITPDNVRRIADKLATQHDALDQHSSSVVQKTCNVLAATAGDLRRLARQMEEPKPAKLPRGWIVTEKDGEFYLVAPDANPGMVTLEPRRLEEGKGPLAERMLAALCRDILKERTESVG